MRRHNKQEQEQYVPDLPKSKNVLPLDQKLEQDYPTFEDFDIERVKVGKPEGKTAKDDKGNQIKYQISSVTYNCGSEETPMYDECLIEGCEMFSNIGITSREAPSGKMDHTIMVKFRSDNECHEQFINCMNLLHAGCALGIQSHQKDFSGLNFDAQLAIERGMGLKLPYYSPPDGGPFSMFLKLYKRGTGAMAQQTLFTDLHGDNIEWDLLRNVEMNFIPLFRVKRIYCGGGRVSIQMEVASAIVTEVRPIGSVSKQLSSAKRYLEKNPEKAESVKATLAKLRLERQDQVSPGINSEETQSNEGNDNVNSNTQNNEHSQESENTNADNADNGDNDEDSNSPKTSPSKLDDISSITGRVRSRKGIRDRIKETEVQQLQ